LESIHSKAWVLAWPVTGVDVVAVAGIFVGATTADVTVDTVDVTGAFVVAEAGGAVGDAVVGTSGVVG